MRVSVRDFGTGLPVEEPERIFERFFSTKRDGMGMGLAIARSIIASHGGELAATNAEGGGACVGVVSVAELVRLTQKAGVTPAPHGPKGP